jgi:hypothetical protein
LSLDQLVVDEDRKTISCTWLRRHHVNSGLTARRSRCLVRSAENMRLYLVDADETVAVALAEAFRPFPEVAVSLGDLLAVAQNSVVSPANAFGFMDGGIDAAFRKFFGAALESRVREAIGRRQDATCRSARAWLFRPGTRESRT